MSTKTHLNKEQLRAATHTSGPLLVVAGAGTGKTTVLVERLKFLLDSKLAKADEVLITTFTEKAAGEMEERADKILPYGYVDLWICTFHGLCERVLREHAYDIGISADFKLVNQTESWILIKKNLSIFKLDYYRPLGNPTKFIHELLKHFSRLKDEDISPQEYLNYAKDIKLNKDSLKSLELDEVDREAEVARVSEIANAYSVYNQLLLDEGYLDFGDLITYTIKLFRERPNILKHYRNKFKYIMVDEFQDTNWSQNELIKILSAPKNNLMVVGDDDQAIYKFRGASISNIMQFKEDYDGTEEVVLLDNYRSGQVILNKAYQFIKNNDPNRLEVRLGIKKELKAYRGDVGSVEYLTYQEEYEEISSVAKCIKELFQKDVDVKWSDFAILVRANSTALNYIDELTRQNIPHQFMSLRGLYYKPIIIDVVSYLKLLDNYHESSALYRVLNIPLFKVGYEDIMKINKFARNKHWSLFEALKNVVVIREVTPESVVKINLLLSLIESHSKLVQSDRPTKVLVSFLYESGLIESLNIDLHRDEFSFLNQFYMKLKKFETNDPSLKLKDFMEMLDMELEAGETGALKQDFEDSETLKIMTIHGSKGLEFKYVFIPNMVDKKFPTIRRAEKIKIPDALVREKLPEGDTHIEEERRLFYVAITRARDNLYLTNAKDYGGAREKKPSKFLEESNIVKNNILPVGEVAFLKKLEVMREVNDLKNPKNDVPTPKYQLPAKFSFSQIAAFTNCPLQYKYNFILRIPVPENPAMQFGRLMHNVLSDFLMPSMVDTITQASLFGGDQKKYVPQLKDIINIYEKKWIDFGYESREQCEEYKKKGRDILVSFFSNLDLNNLPKVVALEKAFMLKMSDFVMRGSIDRVDELPDGSLEIIDYKTGNP
ncbi:UvrD-helicase domain-containing protein, partial [Patescibacteria group bacterium]|nr:UvrD-helicase domain-containing protein [Patescibacteria group bacterium]